MRTLQSILATLGFGFVHGQYTHAGLLLKRGLV